MVAMTCHLPSRGWGASRGSNPFPRYTHTHVEFPVHSDEWRWLYFDSSDSARDNRKLHVYNVDDQAWSWDQGLEPTTSELTHILPPPSASTTLLLWLLPWCQHLHEHQEWGGGRDSQTRVYSPFSTLATKGKHWLTLSAMKSPVFRCLSLQSR